MVITTAHAQLIFYAKNFVYCRHSDRRVAVAFGVKGEEMAPSPPPVQGEALLTYTREEVAQHKKIGDCWIILHGEVYDVTKWLARHPGGARIVMHYAGEDATVSGSCV